MFSPELALVDPVLRRALLAALPDRPQWYPEEAGPQPRSRPRDSVVRARRGASVVLLAAGSAAILFGVTTSSRPPRPGLVAPLADLPDVRPLLPAIDAASAADARARRPSRAAALSKAGRKSDSAASNGRGGRTFAWPRVARARGYLVRVYRGSERIFERSVARPTVRVPRSWAFGGHRYALLPGIYEWSVRPQYTNSSHTRYGGAVVRATLTVTAAPRG